MARMLGERVGDTRPLSVLDGFLGRPLVPEDSIY